MYTLDDAHAHLREAINPPGKTKANECLKQLRLSLPNAPGACLDIDMARFDWLSYLAMRSPSDLEKIFRSAVIAFSIEVFPEREPNAGKMPNHQFRADFVCLRADGTAVRLHPHKTGKDAQVREGSLQAWRTGTSSNPVGVVGAGARAQVVHHRVACGMEDAASSMSTSDPGLSFDNFSLQDRTSLSESLPTVVETGTSGHMPETIEVVAVDDVEYSQENISPNFSCGRSLQTLIDELNGWAHYPLETNPFLLLEAVTTSNGRGARKIISNDNRRLYCLKTHQENVRMSGWIVHIRVKLVQLPNNPAVSRFVNRYYPEHGPHSIRVRRRSASPLRRR